MLGGLSDRIAYLAEGGAEHLTALITSIIATLIALGSLIETFLLLRRKASKMDVDTTQTSAETDQTIASTMNAYEEAIKRANDRAERVELRYQTLEEKIAEKQRVIDETIIDRDQMVAEFRTQMTNLEAEKRRMIAAFETEISQRDQQIRELVDWAERLVHQVRSLGGDPVALRRGAVPSIEQETKPSSRRKKRV